MASTLPLRQLLPTLGATGEPALEHPAQQAFRQALREVAQLRGQVLDLRNAQAAARQAYWRQVGPLAAATVAARRALYQPLEDSLLGGYLTRAEEAQVTELLVLLARDLEHRFGEDEAEILARYASPPPPPHTEEPALLPGEPALAPPHEQQAAAAQTKRRQRADAAMQAAAAANQELLGSTKATYRELARRHHPDRAALADAATQQAQTILMQRVTAAYATGDLAALLTLLAEDTNTTSASEVNEDLLTRYTQALAQQRAQLAQQLANAQAAPQPWGGTEKQQRTRLRESKRSLRAEIDYLQALQRHLHEPAALRQLLRELPPQGI